MKTIQGPAVFLAQFIGDAAPFDTLEGLCRWAAGLGYKGVQIPTWESRLIDLERVATDPAFAADYKAQVESYGVSITELSTHLQGQLVALHPAYDRMFDAFAPADLHGNRAGKMAWAAQQVRYGAMASRNLGLSAHATFSGALLWHTHYPWPQRPAGLVEDGFRELARLWQPILDVFDECGVDACYELHAGEDLHDGVTFERFLQATGHHPRVKMLFDPSHFILQHIDYLEMIDLYHPYIKAMHVKDAEYLRSGRSGVYGGYQDWIDRPGRFRSIGDGQVDFRGIFSRLAKYDFPGWAVLEWECCIKSPEQGAREGAQRIAEFIIEVTDKAFDDFAGTAPDPDLNREILGLTDAEDAP